jgi:Ca2+-binding RTX toxin-like protein
LGTPGDDVIFGGGSGDIIRGSSSNDVIYVGDVGTKAYGGPGNDRILAGNGNHWLGGGGRDQARGECAAERRAAAGAERPDAVARAGAGALQAAIPERHRALRGAGGRGRAAAPGAGGGARAGQLDDAGRPRDAPAGEVRVGPPIAHRLPGQHDLLYEHPDRALGVLLSWE